MEQFDYLNLIQGINDVKTAARDKGLAKLGDEIINMVYSLSHSLYKGEPTGEKVSAAVLSEAMKQSDLRKYAKPRAKAHDIADSAEALTAYVFLAGKMTFNQMIGLILSGLKENERFPKTIGEKKINDINGILKLLLKIKELL